MSTNVPDLGRRVRSDLTMQDNPAILVKIALHSCVPMTIDQSVQKLLLQGQHDAVLTLMLAVGKKQRNDWTTSSPGTKP